MRWAVVLGIAPALVIFLTGRIGPDVAEALTSPWTGHAAVVLTVGTGVLLVLRAWRMVAVLLPVTGWALATALPVMVPDGSLGREALRGTADVRVASWNPLMGTTPGPDARAWLARLDVDLLAVPESTTAWEIAIRATGRWPYAVVENDDQRPNGIALFSRLALEEARVVRSPRGFPLVEAVVRVEGTAVRVLAVHPPSPVSRGRIAARRAEMEWIAERVRGATEAVIVMGDFNDTPYGRAYGLLVKETGLTPAGRIAAARGTWPTGVAGVGVPSWLGIQIDHVLMSRELEPVSFEVGPGFASDHRAVVAAMNVRAERGTAERGVGSQRALGR